MPSVANRRPASLRILVGLSACLAVLLLAASSARASTSPYCNNETLAGYALCTGEPRWLNQLYGWGDQHAICLWVAGAPGAVGAKAGCSGGPGEGVYSPQWPEYIHVYPQITNSAAGANRVHGVAFQP